ncbi:hypothetical protein MMC32_007554, partial [Xylographa parallela]|nr:hypothetical protein [Xylographa parallela]
LLTLGPAGIIFPSTTLLPPSPATAPSQTPAPTFSALTTLGLTLALNPSRAIIANTTLTIGPGATPTTVTVDGETLTANADGLVFPSTTIAPLALPATVTFSAVDVGGLQVSIAPGEVFVSGTEYAVGAGATATTVVVGGETVVAGPGGLVVAGTTVGGPQETGVAGVVGTAGVVGSAGVLGSGSVLGRGGRSAEVGCGMWGALLVGVVWGLGVC